MHLIRTYSAGVHFGELVKREGKEVTLKNARRVYYWKGAASLSQLAMEGVTFPEECKITIPVKKIILTEAIEVIKMSEEAIANLNEVTPWRV